MTIDAAEIARLREEVHKSAYAAWVLDLLDELEEARAERDDWQRELSHERSLRCKYAGEAEVSRSERAAARALLQDAVLLATALRTRIAKLLGDA